MIGVNLHSDAAEPPLRRAEIQLLVERCLPPGDLDGGEVGIAFVGDEAIARLNREFLGRKGATDVIAFRLEDRVPEEGDRTVGEVVVSMDTARRHADRRGGGLRDEVALYVVHGLLHLAGYDDGSPSQRRAMHAREREVLTDAGFSHVR